MSAAQRDEGSEARLTSHGVPSSLFFDKDMNEILWTSFFLWLWVHLCFFGLSCPGLPVRAISLMPLSPFLYGSMGGVLWLSVHAALSQWRQTVYSLICGNSFKRCREAKRSASFNLPRTAFDGSSSWPRKYWLYPALYRCANAHFLNEPMEKMYIVT